jgi:hypothetical protein
MKPTELLELRDFIRANIEAGASDYEIAEDGEVYAFSAKDLVGAIRLYVEERP